MLCPFLTGAILDRECEGAECQLWNPHAKDCGLVAPRTLSVVTPDRIIVTVAGLESFGCSVMESRDLGKCCLSEETEEDVEQRPACVLNLLVAKERARRAKKA